MRLCLVVLLVLGLVPPLAVGAQDEADPQWVAVERFAGLDRFDTAARIATATFDAAPTALVARSDLFPDALAGNYLADQVDGPILLLPTVVADAGVASAMSMVRQEGPR